MSAERWRSSRVCEGLHSAPVRRSFDKEIGATRVVVVMFSPCRRMRETRRLCGGLRGSGGSRFGSFYQDELERAKEFADLRASNDEGWKKAQGKVVRAIDQQTLTQGLGDEGIAINGELNTEDQTFAANFADKIELGGQLDQAFAELCATGADIFDELLILKDVQKFERGSTD